MATRQGSKAQDTVEVIYTGGDHGSHLLLPLIP
jgi:hypothetical protein